MGKQGAKKGNQGGTPAKGAGNAKTVKKREKRGKYAVPATKAAEVEFIKECVEKGMSAREIRKAKPGMVAAARTVRNYVKTLKGGGTVSRGRKAGGGRKPKDPALPSKIRAMMNDDGLTISQNVRGLARKFKAAREQARTAVKKLGLKNVAKTKAARMSPKNVHDRLQFAQCLKYRAG